MSKQLSVDEQLGTSRRHETIEARLRQRIGGFFLDRFRDAIGPGADPRVLETVAMAFFGALLHAGMGLVSYDTLADRLDDVMNVIMRVVA